MRLFLKIVVGVFVVFIAAGFILSQLISKQHIVDQVSEKVEQVTGRQLQVLGDTQLQFFPSLALGLNDVKFSNHQQGSKPQMVTIDNINLQIPWLSALSGEVEIDQFVIDSPNILLEKYDASTMNWQLLASKQQPSQSTNTESSPAVKLPDSFDIKLGQVQVNNGRLTYVDHTTGQTQTIEELNLAVLLPSLKEPLNLKGSVLYMDKTITLDTKIMNPIQVINQQDFSVSLAINSDVVNMNYNGDITEQGQNISGNMSLSGSSLKQLLAWQNIQLTAKPEAFNQFALASDMNFKGTNLNLSNISITLDELDINGGVDVKLLSPIDVSAVLNLGVLNLNPYLPSKDTSAAKVVDTGNDEKASDKPSQPIVWDDSKIDFSALAQINTNVRINSTQLQLNDIILGENDLQVIVKDSVANIQLHTFKGYEGTGQGTINVNAQKQPYVIKTNFSLDGINSQSLLNDAAGFDKLMGKGQLGWQLTTTGQSQKSFIDALNGQFDFSFVDGAVKGFNLAAVARSAQSLLKGDVSKLTLDKDFSQSEKTDFASLTGSFNVVNGVANSTDIALLNPFVRVAGSGDINLPETKVKMKVKTTVVASTEGQQANGDESGLTIPIKIYGPFHDVKVKADVSSEAKDKLKDSLKKKFKNLFG